MNTLGTWLSPAITLLVGWAVARWLGWFQPRSRRRVALLRIAERLAAEDAHGYDYKYDRFLEHYLGGRDWHEEWEMSDTRADDGTFYDGRGPAPKWWQRILTAGRP